MPVRSTRLSVVVPVLLGLAVGVHSATASAEQPAPMAPVTAPPSAAPATVPGAPPPAPVAPDQTTAAPPETAASPQTTMGNTVSAFAALGYSYGFSTALGVGARYQITLVPKGFLHHLPPQMHDEFALEPGFDYFHASYGFGAGYSWDYNEYTPLVGALWNIWINDNLAVYPKLDVGFRIASWSESTNGMSVNTGHADLFPLYFQAAAGIAYRLGIVSLRAEVGWEALRAGVGVTL